MSKDKTNDLIFGDMRKALLSFALPMMFSGFLQSVYGAVDLLVVGRYADSAAVSAVSIGSQVMQLITMIVNGLSMGGTVEIGIRIGEKNERGVCRTVGNITILFCLLALFLTPAMLFGASPLVRLMQTPEEAVSACTGYLLICSAGLPFIVGYNAVSSVYRGIGDSKTPVLFIGVACAVNVILDFLLTGFFGMGASGAAFATTVSQALSFLFALFHMRRGGFPYRIGRKDFKPDRKLMEKILLVGIPLAVQDALVHFSFMAITAIINTLGLVASAAVGVGEKILGFAFLIPSAFGGAIATASAQNIGAGKPDRPKMALRWGIIYSVVCGAVICLLCWTVPGALISIFSRDPDVIKAGASYIASYSLDCILTGFVFCLNGYLNGHSRSIICFAHSMAATFLVRVPGTWLLRRISTDVFLMPMGFAAPAASLLSIGICLLYLKHMEKKFE